jgi:putative PIN family toxin of toxin-antitoxin system
VGGFDICASLGTLGELALVLERGKFDRYLDRESRQTFVALIRRSVHLFDVRDKDLAAVDPPCRDLKDNQFLALAQVAEADTLVSSDDDLLVLHPWRGIPIVTPAQFLEWNGTASDAALFPVP